MDTNNLLRQLLMIGVGTTSLVAERVKLVTEEWVREGKFNPEQARTLVDEVMAQLSEGNGASGRPVSAVVSQYPARPGRAPSG
jgi:polyhydroxyalkanoate synthesis regulator phasin